jgi:hypothetical protein
VASVESVESVESGLAACGAAVTFEEPIRARRGRGEARLGMG